MYMYIFLVYAENYIAVYLIVQKKIGFKIGDIETDICA